MSALALAPILGALPSALEGSAALAAALRRSDDVALAAVAARAENAARDDDRQQRKQRRAAVARWLRRLEDGVDTGSAGAIAAAVLGLADEGVAPGAVADALDVAARVRAVVDPNAENP